jgi:hypothetical protein
LESQNASDNQIIVAYLVKFYDPIIKLHIMENPFDLLDQRMQTIEEKLDGLIQNRDKEEKSSSLSTTWSPQNSFPSIWEYQQQPKQICVDPKSLIKNRWQDPIQTRRSR